MIEKVTIYDIAKKLDITAATVSRALNNNPKISPATRQLVLDTAAKMNYKQNKLALALRSGKSNNIGVIVPEFINSFFPEVILGIQKVLLEIVKWRNKTAKWRNKIAKDPWVSSFSLEKFSDASMQVAIV